MKSKRKRCVEVDIPDIYAREASDDTGQFYRYFPEVEAA